MSNRAHRRPRRPRRIDWPLIERLAALHAAKAGCICQPDVKVHHDQGRVTVAHDDDCPALHGGQALVVIPPHRRANRS